MLEELKMLAEVIKLPDDVIGRMKITIANTAPGYTCARGPRPSGAMIVTPFGMTILGLVKPPTGSPTCKEVGCMMENGHCVQCLHAEVDAIMYAAKNVFSVRGGVIYSINKPCYNCTLHIIAAGIKSIYYAYTVYDEKRTINALKNALVECIHVPID